MSLAIEEDGGAGAVRHAAADDPLPEQSGVRRDSERRRRGLRVDSAALRGPGSELVELVHQAGEHRARERTGATDDDAVGRVGADESAARGPADQDLAVRCGLGDPVVLGHPVEFGLGSGAVSASVSVFDRRRDDDRRRTAARSWRTYHHRDEETDRGSHAESRHAADRHDQHPDGDDDRHHDGRATCSTRFHAPITSGSRPSPPGRRAVCGEPDGGASRCREAPRCHCSRKNCSPTSTRAPRSTR